MSFEADHVHVGRDGWLFLTAGSNNVIGQFNRSRFMRNCIRAWRRLILSRMDRCRALGARYIHVIVPEKVTIYDHKLDGLKVSIRLSPAQRLRRALLWHPRARRACLDLIGAFRKARDAEDLFFRTDSHWSFAGCRLAYRRICAACDAQAHDDFGERPSRVQENSGDLGTKLTPPRTETARYYSLVRDSVRSFASPIVRVREAAGQAPSLHVGAHVVYRNETAQADPRRIALFGDSYAHFAPIMLTVMLAETFREVHFIWSSSIDWGYVERTKPDIVIAEIAERFMLRVPDDRFDVEAYAEERFGEELKEAAAQRQAGHRKAGAARRQALRETSSTERHWK